MNSKEINETIDKLEGLFDKMIQLKTLDNESRRLKLQEAKGGKQFPSGGFATANEHKVNEVVEDRETGSMFELMGHVFNPNANEKTFDVIQDQFKKDFRCQP